MKAKLEFKGSVRLKKKEALKLERDYKGDICKYILDNGDRLLHKSSARITKIKQKERAKSIKSNVREAEKRLMKKVLKMEKVQDWIEYSYDDMEKIPEELNKYFAQAEEYGATVSKKFLARYVVFARGEIMATDGINFVYSNRVSVDAAKGITNMLFIPKHFAWKLKKDRGAKLYTDNENGTIHLVVSNGESYVHHYDMSPGKIEVKEHNDEWLEIKKPLYKTNAKEFIKKGELNKKNNLFITFMGKKMFSLPSSVMHPIIKSSKKIKTVKFGHLENSPENWLLFESADNTLKIGYLV